MTRGRRGIALACLLLVAGCSTTLPPMRVPPPPPVSAPETEVSWEDGLTLDEAIALAMRRNPSLLAARARHGVASALRTQARTWPFNPEVTVGGRGDGPFRGRGESSFGAEVAQTFETGGQRGRREAVAEAQGRQIGWEALDAERGVREEVVARFYRLLALARKADLADQALDLARKLEEIAGKRVKAGDLPALEANLSKVEVQRALTTQAQARTALRREGIALCRALGEPERADLKLVGNVEEAGVGQEGDLVSRALAARPDLQAARAAAEAADRSVGLARSRRAPDVTLSAQYERERSAEGADVSEFLGGALTVPIPIWNRQQGECAQAEADLAVARAEAFRLEREVVAEVASLLERVALARESVDRYRVELMPLVKTNLDLNEAAFRAGQVGTLLLLKAQQDYIDTSSAWLDALAELHEARAALESAIGTRGP